MRIAKRLSKKHFIAAASAAAMLFCAACIPDPLEVRGIPRVKPEIVVSSVQIPDGSVGVFLTKTFGALDASDDSDPEAVINQIAVEDAIVVIRSAFGVDTLPYLGNGVYGGVELDLRAGSTYTLEAESQSLGKVKATTIVKPQVRFEKVSGSVYFDGFDDTLAQISYSFKDLPEKNWYVLNVLKVDSTDIASNLLNPRDFTRVLDDSKFQGGIYSETFRVFPAEFQKGDTLAVFLGNVNRDYFEFLQMRLDNRFSFAEFLAEPVNYPTNVEGGRGFFNLYTPHIEFVVLE